MNYILHLYSGDYDSCSCKLGEKRPPFFPLLFQNSRAIFASLHKLPLLLKPRVWIEAEPEATFLAGYSGANILAD